jgi:hypothetical protein
LHPSIGAPAASTNMPNPSRPRVPRTMVAIYCGPMAALKPSRLAGTLHRRLSATTGSLVALGFSRLSARHRSCGFDPQTLCERRIRCGGWTTRRGAGGPAGASRTSFELGCARENPRRTGRCAITWRQARPALLPWSSRARDGPHSQGQSEAVRAAGDRAKVAAFLQQRGEDFERREVHETRLVQHAEHVLALGVRESARRRWPACATARTPGQPTPSPLPQ